VVCGLSLAAAGLPEPGVSAPEASHAEAMMDDMDRRDVVHARRARSAWIVTCALLLSAVAGCGSGEDDAADAPAASRSASTSAASATASTATASTAAPSSTAPSGDPLPPGSIPSPAALSTAAVPPSAAGSAAVRRFAVIGDSITAGSEARSSATAPGPGAWLRWVGGAPLKLQDGWAAPGASTADMRAHAGPSTAEVLVMLGGTNDISRGIDWADSAADLRAIAASVGSGSVLALAIPPSDAHPVERGGFNVALAQLAADEGWGYLDPWTSVDAGGAYAPGASLDGIHPTPEVARLVGEQVRAELLLGGGLGG
jgi:acyl-CoA thioesterase-1